MEAFICENVSQINKFNNIIIKLGKKMNNSMFDYSFNKSAINKFILNCKNMNIHFTKQKPFYRYSYMDYNIEGVDNKISYSTMKTLKYIIINHQSTDLLISLTRINKSSTNITSIHKYNSIIYVQDFTHNYNNLFNINISQHNQLDNDKKNVLKTYFTINIIIKKTVNNSDIQKHIFKVLNLVN